MNKPLFALLLLFISQIAQADVTVANAWARATAPGQDVGAAYMTLTSSQSAKLVGVNTPAADSVEIHEMSMKNGIMKMRMKDVLDLPAGKTVKLEPNGFHFMLFDLKKPLKAGENLEFTLSIKDSQGKLSRQKVSVPVKAE